ncbi:hypothetical protein IKE80_02485 [Candidatus Saccharibacteria bacterium]|nr:hypothetical protein [Candidatus Saccharibacteria bacterium]MBR3177740.1 hypothetical protein [Candidatus Saccharibacteria bacterium]
MFGIADNTEFLAAIGIANAPEETKAKLIAGIEDSAQKRLVVKLSERLTEAQAEEFNAITDEAQAADWLKVNVPDFDQIISEVLSEVREDILARRAKVVG